MNFFEDLKVGRTFDTQTRLVTEEDVTSFAREWDPQPFHTDKDAAKASLFGRLSASGFHTLLISYRMCVEIGAFRPTGLAGLELEKVVFRKPVFPGDAIRARLRVLQCRRSQSRPKVGIVTWEMLTHNQDDDLVLSMQFTNMVKMRAFEDAQSSF